MDRHDQMQTFEIKIIVNDESELYSPFDPDKRILSDDLIAYLSDRYQEKEIGKKTVLVFEGVEIVAKNLESALHEHIAAELQKIDKQKKINILKQLRLFVIGLVFVATGIILTNYISAVPTELLSIIGSFAVWEAANIWIVGNPSLKFRQKFLKKLLEADIIVKEKSI